MALTLAKEWRGQEPLTSGMTMPLASTLILSHSNTLLLSLYNMQSDKQQIAKKIKDGSYFKDASNWYAIKYLYPIAERSMMFVFAIAALLALFPIATLFNSMSGDSNKIPFPINVEDSIDHFSIVKPLAEDSESPQEAIARYLISDYVKTREEYIYKNITSDNLRKSLKKIKASSSKQVLDEYTSYVNENNPDSPLVKYKNNTNRFIEIKSITFLDNDQTSGKARIVFEANEETGVEAKKSLWETIINFRLPDVIAISKTGAPLRLLVGYYKTSPIEDKVDSKPKEPENLNIPAKPSPSAALTN